MRGLQVILQMQSKDHRILRPVRRLGLVQLLAVLKGQAQASSTSVTVFHVCPFCNDHVERVNIYQHMGYRHPDQLNKCDLHICEYCEQPCLSQAELDVHCRVNIFHHNQIIRCRKCYRVLINVVTLQKHDWICTARSEFFRTPPDPPPGFNSDTELKPSSHRCSENPTYNTCPICDKYVRRDKLRWHMLNKHRVPITNDLLQCCEICLQPCAGFEALDCHYEVNHKSYNQCSMCHAVFVNISTLKRHTPKCKPDNADIASRDTKKSKVTQLKRQKDSTAKSRHAQATTLNPIAMHGKSDQPAHLQFPFRSDALVASLASNISALNIAACFHTNPFEPAASEQSNSAHALPSVTELFDPLEAQDGPSSEEFPAMSPQYCPSTTSVSTESSTYSFAYDRAYNSDPKTFSYPAQPEQLKHFPSLFQAARTSNTSRNNTLSVAQTSLAIARDAGASAQSARLFPNNTLQRSPANPVSKPHSLQLTESLGGASSSCYVFSPRELEYPFRASEAVSPPKQKRRANLRSARRHMELADERNPVSAQAAQSSASNLGFIPRQPSPSTEFPDIMYCQKCRCWFAISMYKTHVDTCSGILPWRR